MTLSLTATVGVDGNNHRLDVGTVQSLLRLLPDATGGSYLTLEIDCSFGSKTEAAIRRFQRMQLGFDDGLVWPDDVTMKRLNAAFDYVNRRYPHAPVFAKALALTKCEVDLGLHLPGELLPATCADGVGIVLRREHGNVYHHPQTGAFAVYGAILAKYVECAAEQGVLGYPISDERAGLQPGTRISFFQYGSVTWTGDMGATMLAAAGLSAPPLDPEQYR